MNTIEILSHVDLRPANGFIVQYRIKDSGNSFTTLSPRPTQFPITFTVDTTDVDYEINITSDCGFNVSTTTNIVTQGNFTKIWIMDNWYCETTTPFSVTGSYSGYYSPAAIGYIDNNLYVVDYDNTNGKIYYVSPNELTSTGAVKHSIANTTTGTVYIGAVDSENKKVYYTGNGTKTGTGIGGLVYYDLSGQTPILGTIPFGADQTYNKLSLSVLKTKVISVDGKVTTNNVLLLNRTDISDYTILSYSSIGSTNTSGSSVAIATLFANELDIKEDIRGNIIVRTNASTSNSYVSVYSGDLIELKQVIDLKAAPYNVTTGPSGKYRNSMYYDDQTDVLYIYDFGTSTMFKLVYDIQTGKYINSSTNSNYKYPSYGTGKWYVAGIKKDPLTNELWLTGQLNTTESSIVANTNKSYKIDKNTMQPSYFLENTSMSDLIRQGTTNTLWGVTAGSTYTTTTDGLIFKIER